ncbi:hypothetical protein [Streptomyces uncialis]|uniref:hypothetical protein n=1 Tax=Streptomyces uncialis TaxID=1048205 RepID=UPI00386CA7AB|nr:hypothetical protein OG268_03455 [Streptomyces uncialis]
MNGWTTPRTGPAGPGAAGVPAPAGARRAVRALARLGGALALTVTAHTVGAGQATAAPKPIGHCTTSQGVVLAVDFSDWGGPVYRSCGTTPTTGYELLNQGGWRTTGTGHDGPAFICRIGYSGHQSGKQFPPPRQEDCVLTPPASAYWSYWHADPGENTWEYSQLGAMSYRPKPGSVDLWIFGGTDIEGTRGRPTISPDQLRAHNDRPTGGGSGGGSGSSSGGGSGGGSGGSGGSGGGSGSSGGSVGSPGGGSGGGAPAPERTGGGTSGARNGGQPTARDDGPGQPRRTDGTERGREAQPRPSRTTKPPKSPRSGSPSAGRPAKPSPTASPTVDGSPSATGSSGSAGAVAAPATSNEVVDAPIAKAARHDNGSVLPVVVTVVLVVLIGAAAIIAKRRRAG